MVVGRIVEHAAADFNVSVVIPTYNRRTRLCRVLDGLDRQSVAPGTFEVVIVDDGSTDDTALWLADQRRVYPLRTVFQKNGGPARARNTGIHTARGDLLLFLDDDVEPAENLVQEHIRSHAQSTDLVVIGTLGSLPHYEQPWVAWEQAKLEAQYAAMKRGDFAPTFRQFWTGNASVRREHVLAVGGFDPSFLRAEDVELGLRLHRRGLRFVFNPAARGLHYAERSLESWANAHRSYGRLEVRIFGSNGEDELVSFLAANWNRLRPEVRFVVRRCIQAPTRFALVSSMLQRWLRWEASARRSIASPKVCSVLANLLYWQASIETLGPERTDRVFSRAMRPS